MRYDTEIHFSCTKREKREMRGTGEIVILQASKKEEKKSKLSEDKRGRPSKSQIYALKDRSYAY